MGQLGKNTEVLRRMTVLNLWVRLSGLKGAFHQVLIVILINIPTVSFGLAFGWVSLVSGEEGDGEGEAVVAAVTTFAATMAGVPLSAWAISFGRKFAIVATSLLFVVCWSLTLASSSFGVWSVVCARVAAGLGGASAWALAPLMAREMCSDKYRGAAVTALPLMHNTGVLLMYLAADAALPHSNILWMCLGVSVVHCIISLFMPESPSFLAAHGKPKEAQRSLAWLRGMSPDDPALCTELMALPAPELHERSPFGLAKAMLRDRRRRRAFIIGTIAVVGQEMCGILAIMQYAERVFILAGDVTAEEISVATGNVTESMVVVIPTDSLGSPARHAVLLGAVQLVFSAIALYLVERVGRRPLLIWCATLTGIALAGSAVMVHEGSARGAVVALAAAVAADASGLQPAPYSLLADMFDYEFRSCALMLAAAGANAGNTLESAVFPAAVVAGGLTAALGLGAAMTLAYALFAVWAVPETKGRTPEEIYQLFGPPDAPDCEAGAESTKSKTSANLKNNKIIKDEKSVTVDKVDMTIGSNGQLNRAMDNQKYCHQEILKSGNLNGSCHHNSNETINQKTISNTTREHKYLDNEKLQTHCQKLVDENVNDDKNNTQAHVKNMCHVTRDFENCNDKNIVISRLDIEHLHVKQNKDRVIANNEINVAIKSQDDVVIESDLMNKKQSDDSEIVNSKTDFRTIEKSNEETMCTNL